MGSPMRFPGNHELKMGGLVRFSGNRAGLVLTLGGSPGPRRQTPSPMTSGGRVLLDRRLVGTCVGL
jgi:hypothetical protein